MYDLNCYVFNRDKHAHRNDDHIMGLAPYPLPKTPQQAFQHDFARGNALFLPDDSDRVLDALNPSTHDLPPENWTQNCRKSDSSTRIKSDVVFIAFRGCTPIRRSNMRPVRNLHCTLDIRTMRRFVSGVVCLVMRCVEVQSWAACLFSRGLWSRAGSFDAAAAINGELSTGNAEWQCGANVLYFNIILTVLKIRIPEIGQFLRWFSTNMVIPLSLLIGQIPSKTQ
jgi:hypothetical protein